MTWTEKAIARKAELDAIQNRRDLLEAFIATPDWGAMDSGASIKAGDVVRLGLLKYRAKTDHTKALTRSPANIIYWEVI